MALQVQEIPQEGVTATKYHTAHQVNSLAMLQHRYQEKYQSQRHGHVHAESSTAPSEEEFPRDAELPRAPTTRGVRNVTPRFPSGPDRLDYDDAERARYNRFGEIERQLADVMQDAAESEMRREHEFREREAERDHQFAEKQAEQDRQFKKSAGRDEMALTRAPQPPPGAPLPGDVLGVLEPLESVVMSVVQLRSLLPIPCRLMMLERFSYPHERLPVRCTFQTRCHPRASSHLE